MKLELKIHDKNIDRLIDGDAIQMIEFFRDKARVFYTDDEGYTVFTDNFEIVIEFLPHKPIKVEDTTIKKVLKEAKILGEKYERERNRNLSI